MKLYDCTTAPSPRRARIALAEKGLQVPLVQVDLSAGAQLAPEFARLNPWCTVPVLELDDGTTISEASAVIRYLEAAFPEPPLLGRSPAEQATVAMWDHRFEVDGFMAAAEALRNRAKGLKGRAVVGPTPIEQIPELAERGGLRLDWFFSALDACLADGRPFVAGDAFSAADITAFVSVDFAGWVKKRLGDEHSHARRWYAEVAARPSAQA